MISAILLFQLFLARFAQAELVSTGVGLVRGQVVTSREVQIQQLLEAALFEKLPKNRLQRLPIDSKAFNKATQETLLESVIALEAQNFNVIQITAEDVKAYDKQVAKTLKDLPVWKSLQVTPAELQAALHRKVQAKKFVQFRSQSSALPITDAEAERYFNDNRLKFGNNVLFENFKDNIKQLLSKNQVEKRLKDWYDVLMAKYQVKNLIAEI